MKNKKILLISNPYLLIAGLLWCFISVIISIVIIFVLESGNYAKSDFDKKIVQIIFGGLGIIIISATLSCLKNWLTIICFKNMIIFYSPCKKTRSVSYDCYHYVYLAHYIHRNIFRMGYKCKYIVISQFRLSDFDLQHINKVPTNIEVIKLKYSKKRWLLLLNVLPPVLRKQMEKCQEKNI